MILLYSQSIQSSGRVGCPAITYAHYLITPLPIMVDIIDSGCKWEDMPMIYPLTMADRSWTTYYIGGAVTRYSGGTSAQRGIFLYTC